MGFDTIVQGGMVVTPSGAFRADVAIRGEKIAAVGENLAALGAARDARRIDARGHYVLPGLLDVHVHLDLPVGGIVTSDGFASGTRAAARGGVTTVIDFATPYRREDGRYDSLAQAADAWMAKVEGKALVDYSFHMCITNWDRHKAEIKSMMRRGWPTFKEFMVYEQAGWRSGDGALFSTLEAMRDLGGMLLVHAESSSIVDELIRRHHTPALMKKYGARLHPMTRPNFTEYEAIQRAITWSALTGGPLYIVHMSTGEGADLVQEAQAGGVPVLAETCPQYLVLEDSVFRRKEGHLFATCPQIKKAADGERLWAGLRGGEVSVVATDTCTFTRAQKARWRGDWTRIPMGLPGLETMLPLCYTHGVLAGRLRLEQLVEKLAAAPARIMGLAPRKGAIAPGADADLAIIHPTKKIKVRPGQMETRCDWSPYAGWDLAGFSRTTLSRGEVIVDDYRVIGQAGRGQWLARKSVDPRP
jgi:dihydropyrimidinase